MAEHSPYTLRLRQLPKPEYKLMKALVSRYRLKDESELFAVALRLMQEVSTYKEGTGEQWITQVISTYRNTKQADRTAAQLP